MMLQELEKNTPSHKLGVKYLDDNQLTNSFPDWKALLSRIEEQRQIAEFASKKKYQFEDRHFPQTYDNLFAVLGDRGSGKSSVILTMQEKMRKPYKQDILLPIITPEIINERECSILGWIMSAAESVIHELEKRINVLQQNNYSYGQNKNEKLDAFFKDCRFQKNNPLRRAYQDLFEKSISTSGILDTSGYSAEDALGYKVMQSRRQYKLIHDLNNFWNYFTEVWHQTQIEENKQANLNTDNIKHPLIILIFDDIDLVPERSMELLTTTFQYFTNPNIVIILTASENILKKVIHIKMSERMLGSDANSLLMDVVPWVQKNGKTQTRILDRFSTNTIDKMSQDFYDKVIPPSSRYYLSYYNNIEEKRRYSYSSTGQSFWPPQAGETTSISIEEFLIQQVEGLVSAFSSEPRQTKNFLLGGKDGKMFQKAYLMIFGEKSRNIANGCLEIMNTFDRLKKLREKEGSKDLSKQTHDEILLSVRHLVQALLLSKPILREYANQVNSFLYSAPDRIGNFIDYNFALKCYQNEQQAIQDWLEQQREEDKSISYNQFFRLSVDYLGKAKEKIAALMMVMFFAECILLITDYRRRHIHGYRQLSFLLNSDISEKRQDEKFIATNLNRFPQHNETCNFIYNSPLVLEHIGRYTGVNMFDSQYAYNYLNDIFQIRINIERMEPKTILTQAVDKDPEWVKTVLTMLLVRYSGVTFVEPEFIHFSNEIQQKLALFSFTARLKECQEQVALDFLSKSDLLAEADAKMQEFDHITNMKYDFSFILDFDLRLDPFFQIDRNNVVPLQTRDEQYIRFVERLDHEQKFIQKYFASQWDEYNDSENEDKNSSTNKYYQLVGFVKDTLKACINTLDVQTDICLSSDQISEVITYLRRMDDYNLGIKHKRDNCVTMLERAMLMQANKNYNASLSNEHDKEQIFRIPAGALIDYMAEVQKEILETPAELSLFELSDSDNYFNLLELLVISYHNDTLVKNTQSDMILKDLKIPLSSILILKLRMLEFLLPYYFAAHIKIAVTSRYQFELLPYGYGLADLVDKKLKKLYVQLIKNEPGNKKDVKLCELMREARQELARNYYEKLGIFV